MMNNLSRRSAFTTLLGTLPAVSVGSSLVDGLAAETEVSMQGRIYKTLKIGMVKEGDSMAEKFDIARAAGFDGIELNAPGFDVEDVTAAVASTGFPVDGTVCGSHWKIRHSDPDETVRAKALEDLKQSLINTKAIGGHTVLLVVGHGKDGSEEEVWKRSVANIRKAVPLAAKLGVAIAIENVWNHFGYDHEGGSDQSAEKLVKYVDEFESPWVGMQFDIGNHWKYGNPGDWIRALGKRVIKLDIKGFSREQSKFTGIGEGDLDFADVRRALLEINFYGWCAAEVGGGNSERLEEVAGRMDRVLGLV
jgi:hexulose-6-phosphate isomerase|tara:strand:+ start:676 stop:1593 length:918 start_codon:yes stop_codon:yes gene_type:complete